jgi:Ricin-type beta-trefoil lectin domain-like
MAQPHVNEAATTAIDPRTQTSVRVRIQNIKSGRYLSIEGDQSNWANDDASLTIRDWLNKPILESPQVWTIIRYRDDQFTLINQYSKAYACIRGRSTTDNATVIQFHDQFVAEPFQQWRFSPMQNGNWLIQNVNSLKYIGPQGRSTGNDHYCIQWTDQTSEDSYQEWVFLAI